MLVNGIDYPARSRALREAGIDPTGPMSQYQAVLGTAYVYCNQHLGIHATTGGGCTVAALEMFPLAATIRDDAAAECRTRGFRLHLEACPCATCGEQINQAQGTFEWVSVTGRDRVCPASTDTYRGRGHTPVPSVPATAAAHL